MLLQGHLSDYRVRAIWGGLVFPPDGLARLASIFGLIRGIKLMGEDGEAEAYARTLFRALDNLNRTEEFEAENGSRYLKTLTVLCDDGSFNDFAFARYSLKTAEEFEDYRARAAHANERLAVIPKEWSPYPQMAEMAHVYNGNGGVIYRGPGMGEPFSVSVSDNPPLWSIHT